MQAGQDYPLLPVLLGQLVLTAVGAGLVWYLAYRRGRTFSGGREQAMYEALQLTNRTLPCLRQGLNSHTAGRAVEVIFDFFRPAAVALVSGEPLVGYIGTGADHHLVGAVYQTDLTSRALRAGRTMVARSFAEGAVRAAGLPARRRDRRAAADPPPRARLSEDLIISMAPRSPPARSESSARWPA